MSSDSEEFCPNPEVLEAFASGHLEDDDASVIVKHLDECDRCCRKVESISSAEFGDAFAPSQSGSAPQSRSSVLPDLLDQLRDPSVPSDFTSEQEPNMVETLGHYEALEEVARGGMGIVLKAYDPELQRTVALKLLAPRFAGDPGSRERFLSEARAGAKLQHENVMPIYAVDQQGSHPYLVMPFVEGPNLQEHLDRHAPLPFEEILHIAYQTSQALEEAHAHGLIHRDVKPANIMLINHGESKDRSRVWLTDFGLAHAVHSQNGEGETNLVAGTPGFMAPEQTQSEAIFDERADLFALGCVLYAMATGGQSPFQTGSTMATLDRVRTHTPTRLGIIAKDLPKWFDRLTSRLLEKDPDRRPQSAKDVRQILANHLPEKRKLSVGTAILFSSLTVMLAAAVSIVMLRKQEPTIEQGFLIDGQSQIHDTLEQVIDAANAGNTVIVRKQGELELGELVIPNGKALTIRAAKGFSPVFVAKHWRTTALDVQSPLCLEGLEIRHPFALDPVHAKPILKCQGVPVFLANCRFVRSTRNVRAKVLRNNGGPLVELINCESINIANCEFFTMIGTDIALEVSDPGSTSTLHLTNNLMVGQFGVHLKAIPGSSHQWRLDQNTIACANPLFAASRGRNFLRLDIEHNRNLYDFMNCFLGLRRLEDSQSIIRGALATTTLTGKHNDFRRTNLSGGKLARFVELTTLEAREAHASIESFDQLVQGFGHTGREVKEPILDWQEIEAYRAEFSLMKAELYEPAAPPGDPDDAAGFVRDRLGPGEGYRHWTETEDYEKWCDLVVQAMR